MKQEAKQDVFNHIKMYDAWKSELTKDYIEEGLTKENSKLFLMYLHDMETGSNIPKLAKKGCRDVKTINRQRHKVRQILMLFQAKGIKDITKTTEKQVTEFFADWQKTHSVDYTKRFKAFWHWWQVVNRKQGKVILDITEDLSTAEKKKSEFVWIEKNKFDEYRKFFDEDEQTLLLFCYDSIIRAPTELLSLKVENIYKDGSEVWVDIPNNIAKTFGRKFNLLYSGDAVIDYIKRKELKQEDYLFKIVYRLFTEKMQKVAKQVFGEDKSQGGEYYKNITLYDLRHSGAIFFRQLFQKTGQSLDVLRERGGWTDFDMINEYTRRLGLDGHIDKEKTLLQEDKSKMQKEISQLKHIVELQKKENKLKDEVLGSELKAIKEEQARLVNLVPGLKKVERKN